MSLSIIILAAGKGKRMISSLPKVLHPLGGRPLLSHVVKTAESLNPKAIHVVYGNGGSQVREALPDLAVNWIEQKEQLGTGHAVMQAITCCDDDDDVLVLYGDVPLISSETLQQLLAETLPHGLGLVVAELADPSGFGRIIRNEMANIVAIVEHKDATEKQHKINEINTGILTTKAKNLKEWLPAIKNKNKQKEYYLTDIVALAVAAGFPVGGVMARDPEEIQGANDRVELSLLERYYQLEQTHRLMLAGVQVMDPERLDIRGDVTVAQDVTLDINVVLSGTVKIGKNSFIGAGTRLKNVTIGKNVTIKPMSVIEDAIIEDQAQIGPFAHIRPGTVVETGAKVGNFVEVKKTRLGAYSKASHLTYLGDSIIGKNVNIGAGTITCNYDGINKWTTEIKDGAFIGSNTALVAPLIIGKGAVVGAGSTLTADAPAEKLTLTRAQQTTVQDWQKKTPKKARKEVELKQ